MAKKSKYSSNRDRNRKQSKEQGGGGTVFNLPENVDFFDLEKSMDKRDRIEIDVIPYVVNEDEIAANKTIYVHYNVGPERKSYICPKTKSESARCPMCEQYAIDRNDPSLSDKEAGAMRPTKRTMFNIIDLNNTKAGVQLWVISHNNFTKLLGTVIADDDESPRSKGFVAYDDPEEGFTLDIKFAQDAWAGNKFLKASLVDFIKRDDPYDDDVIDSATNLDKVPVILSFDKLKSIMMGVGDEDTSDSKDGDVPYHESTEEASKEPMHKSKRTEDNGDDPDNGDDNPCPYGGEFGADYGKLDDCEDCSEVDLDCEIEKRKLKRRHK